VETIEYPLRLQRYLSLAGVCSRREAETLIAAGRVAVNGQPVTAMGVKVNADDRVNVDGRPALLGRRCYVMLNKPRGYVCTADDPQERQKAVDLVNVPGLRLYHAGRLDKDSEGLLIFTNDGDYAARLMHPRYRILKHYVVQTDRPLTPAEIQALTRGIEDNGEFLKPEKITELSPRRYSFVLNEGKKREIRRMIAWTWAQTLTLKRVAVGALELGDLPTGRWRELSPAEVELSLRPDTVD